MTVYDESDNVIGAGLAGAAGSSVRLFGGAGVNGPTDFSPGGSTITASVTGTVPLTIDLNQPITEQGRKFDGGKLEYGLLPPKALEAVVDVLTFGAQKYDRDNWKLVPDSKRRYFDALQRHLWAYKSGEILDQESGKHHLAHAMCCLMFLYEHDTIYSLDNEKVSK